MAGTDKFITVNGLKLHYVEHGKPNNPPFVYLHGIGSHGHGCDTFTSQVSDCYRVLALTARGHGDSDRAESYEARMFIEDAAAFIEAAAGAPSVVCGVSMGSMVGLAIAALHSDKVAKLIAVEGGPRSNREGTKRIADAMRNAPSSFDTIEEAMQAARAWAGDVRDDELRRLIEYDVLRGDDGKLRRKTDARIGQLAAETAEAGGAAELENLLWTACGMIKCPTLIVRGSRSDILDRETAEQMVETIPDARVVEVESGHAVPLENPEGFYEAVRGFI